MKKTLSVICLLVTVLLLGCSRNNESAQVIGPEAVGHYQRGRTHYSKEEFSEAEEAFKTALEVSPRFANAAYMLGKVYFFQGRLDEAEARFKDALSQGRPGHVGGYLWLSRIYSLDEEKTEEAKKMIEEALQLAPENGRIYYELGRLYELEGDLRNALLHYELGMALEADYAALHFRAGELYEKIGLSDRARKEYERALAFDPDFDKAKRKLTRYRD